MLQFRPCGGAPPHASCNAPFTRRIPPPSPAHPPTLPPPVRAQAMDRAHRLGQERPVTVYRLVCQGTVEERILLRAAQKRTVQRLVMSEGAGAGAAAGGGAGDGDELGADDVAAWLLDDGDPATAAAAAAAAAAASAGALLPAAGAQSRGCAAAGGAAPEATRLPLAMPASLGPPRRRACGSHRRRRGSTAAALRSATSRVMPGSTVVNGSGSTTRLSSEIPIWPCIVCSD